MFLVDERIGSRDLLTPLIHSGVPAELAHLDFGDFAFFGRGQDDIDIMIGIELKESRDLIASMRSDRFAGHQLPGLQSTYDRAWLITEGIWRSGDGGILEVMAGGWRPISLGGRRTMLRDVESWILSQVVRGGISHWHCQTRRDTLRFLSVLYHWWTDKSLEEHRSHQVIYQPPPDRAMVTSPSTFVRMMACIEKVGWDRAVKLEAHFRGSISVLKAASATDLQKVDGIGKVTALNILKALE